jgi:hypothetical protein
MSIFGEPNKRASGIHNTVNKNLAANRPLSDLKGALRIDTRSVVSNDQFYYHDGSP